MQKDEDPKQEIAEKVDLLKVQESHLSSLCASNVDCIVLHDLNGDIIEVNRSASIQLGYSPHELVKLNLKDIQPNTKRGSDAAPIALEIYKDSKVDITRTVFVRKDGSRLPADVKTTYVRFSNPSGLVTVVQRVFREMSANRRVPDPDEQVLQADLASSQFDFMGLVKQHLKAPIEEMLGALKLLNVTPLNDEQLALLKLTEKSGDYIIGAVNDVADLFYLGNEKIQFKEEEFNLSLMVQNLVEEMTPLANQRQLRLANYVEADILEYVRGDKERIRQVLFKLLSNAFQKTEQGSIRIEINRSDEGAVRFEIIDSGRRIDEADIVSLLADDLLTDVDISTQCSDVALDYILARQLVVQMGGEFGFFNNEEQGTTFWFELILCEHEQRSGRNAKYKFLDGYNVVFIDYSSESHGEVMRQLSSWGAEVYAFDDEEAAVSFFSTSYADRVSPALIVLNVHPSDGTYAALLREVNTFLNRSNDTDQGAHFVIITPGNFSPQTARHFVRIKHTEVSHPLRLGSFANKLARLIMVEEPYDLSADEGEKRSVDVKVKTKSGRILLVDDGKVTQKATAMLLKKFGFEIDCADDGIEAIKAFQQKHYDIILMDVEMPRLNGIEATKRIRVLENHESHTPILAVTASMKDDIWRECVYAGMDDYMTKPIHMHEMVATIEYWMGTNEVADPFNIGDSRNGDSAESQDTLISESEVLRAIKLGDAVNQQTIRQLELDTSVEMAAEMVDLFLEEIADRIEKLHSAMGTMNLPAVAEEAHSMMSSSSTFGANWLQRLARSLEEQAKKQNTDVCDELIGGLNLVYDQSKSQLKSIYHS